ncbi:MAG TPA: PEGA domain-containing protein, partial [Thermoplasmatales archaeon]|nr:PEGA domain-containing protein [Thermoplasmatales archaeon]
ENAYGETSVEFIIDDESKAIVDEEPFNYTWNERAFCKHHIEVIAYDDFDGLPTRTANASMDVLIFNLALKRNKTEETGVVKGKVYDSGTLLKKGIGGVKITVIETNETYTTKRILSKGKYCIKLAPGTYHLKFEKKGYVTKIVEVTVNASEVTKKNVGLDRMGTLYGRVLKKSKLLFRGIRGATVEAVNNDTGEHFSVNTSFRGKYSMELPPGNYTVTASAEGYTCVTEYVTIEPGKAKKLNFKLEKEESS